MTRKKAPNIAKRNTIVNSETGRAGRAAESLMIGEAFSDPRVANWDKFRLRKTRQVSPKPNPANTCYRGDHPQEVKRKERQRVAVIIFKRGENIVTKINEDDRQNPNHNRLNLGVDDLVLIREEIKERHEEMSEQNHQADIPPLIGGTIVVQLAQIIPKGLLWHIGIPDQKILRKSDIGPKDREGEG